MARVLVGAGAELDNTESLRWYAQRSKQAAEAFEAEFVRALEAIAESPDRHPACDSRHRFHRLKRDPFQVIFRRVNEEALLIVAVAHTSRSPEYWSAR